MTRLIGWIGVAGIVAAVLGLLNSLTLRVPEIAFTCAAIAIPSFLLLAVYVGYELLSAFDR